LISFENLDGAGLARGSLVDMISSKTESRPAGGRFSGDLLVREICLSNSAIGSGPVCGSEMEGLDANILLTSRNMTVWMYYKTIIKPKLSRQSLTDECEQNANGRETKQKLKSSTGVVHHVWSAPVALNVPIQIHCHF